MGPKKGCIMQDLNSIKSKFWAKLPNSQVDVR